MSTTLSSKITGVQLWAYDIARRPDKTLDSKGYPQILSYNKSNTQADVVIPVTQNPTDSLSQLINEVFFVCDVKHIFNGGNLNSHGIKFAVTDQIDHQLATIKNISNVMYTNISLNGDDVYIQDGSNTVINTYSKDPFTTNTQGIKIVYQTGIVQQDQGHANVTFELEAGYKIPVGATIKATPMIENSFGTATYAGTPKTYPVVYEIQSGVYSLLIKNNQNGIWDSCDIDFSTVQTTPTEPTTPTKPTTIPLVQKLTNAKSNITGDSIDRKLNAISLTADQGYTFQTSIQILFYSDGKVVSEYNIDGNNSDSITIPLNTTKENTIVDSMDSMQFTVSATIATVSTSYEHNYLITDPELNALSNEKIWNYVGGEQGETDYNISSFINNLIQLPFIVDTENSIQPISLGREKSKTVSHEVKKRFVTLDLGNIKVPSKYNNAYDYQTQTIKLFTPFVTPITIDPINAITQTIHVVYNVDISNGNLTVNLYNDDVLFFTGANNISSQLPFLSKLQNTIINRNTHFTDNDIRQPYIIVSRETPILESDYYPTNERGLIKSYNGNIHVRLLNNMNIPNNELSELTSQLESGVKYVKN